MIDRLKLTPLYRAYLAWDALAAPVRWRLRGRPVPPPASVKRRIVRSCLRRYGLRQFVETGTYLGTMVRAVRRMVDRVWSIELDHVLARHAARTFARDPRVVIIEGDSGDRLPEVLRELDSPALFWLDSHYSGGITARGDLDSPILRELEYIAANPITGHVLLIDDARCFTGEGGYPTLDRLRAFIADRRPDWTVAISDDIIRITPGIVPEQAS